MISPLLKCQINEPMILYKELNTRVKTRALSSSAKLFRESLGAAKAIYLRPLGWVNAKILGTGLEHIDPR